MAFSETNVKTHLRNLLEYLRWSLSRGSFRKP